MSLPLFSSSLKAHHDNLVALFNKAGEPLPKLLVKQPPVVDIPSPVVDYRDSAIPFLAINSDFSDFIQQNLQNLASSPETTRNLKRLKNMPFFVTGSYYINVDEIFFYDIPAKSWQLKITLTDTEIELLPDELPSDKMFFNVVS